MASRAEQKAAARAQREALQKEHTQAAQRRQRLSIVGGVIGLALILVIIAIVVSSQKSGPTGAVSGAKSAAVVNLVENELKGIPQSGTRLGSPNAPVTIKFFGDLECSFCKEFSTGGAFSQLLTNQIRTGHVQITYHSLETASQGNPDPNAFQNQQVAALAASLQNRMWDYIELFYQQQGTEDTGYVTTSFLTHIANQIPGKFDVKSWQGQLGSTTLANQVQQDIQLAQSYGFSSTPSFSISGPKGTQSPTGFTYPEIASTINAVS